MTEKDLDEFEKDKENLIFKLNNGIYENIQLDTKDINMMKDDIDLYRAFIGSLEYAKTGERKWFI